MKLKKIHGVLTFKQSNWMKKYINFNTEKKQMLLIVLKKIVLNWQSLLFTPKQWKTLRKYVWLVTKEKGFLKYTSRPTHITHEVLDKDYAAIHEINPVLKLNKTTYVGFTVLELSKWLLYDFHYNCIKRSLMLNCYLLT